MPRPVPEVALSARAYQRQSGIHVVPSAAASNAIITERASRQIGDAYGRLPSFDAGAVPAYRAMREETGRQFDHMTAPRRKGGLGLDVEITKEDPYGGGDINKIFSDLHHDVRENNRIQALSTKTTGGHPFFSNDENDMFRAVHDVYGHLGSGRGVDHNGEEAAFQKHAQMFSPLARQAMATETRGQNSHLRVHGDFPEQKVALLPEHMQGLQFNRQGSAADIVSARNLARSRSADQGIR